MTGTSTAAPRVLVVEDEYLIRMLLEDMLDELGYGVAAAVGTISEARKIAADGEFSAAILDVNLNGEFIYPLADVVASRGVPFVFVTGYSADGIEPRFARVPVLQNQVLSLRVISNGRRRRLPSG